MNTISTPTTLPGGRQSAPTVGGIFSLARAELTMLLRNRTAIVNTIIVPLLLVFAIYSVNKRSGADLPTNMLIATSVVLACCYVIYYNLVTTYVARRESYVLKRMRTGTVSDGGILLATAIPSLTLGLLQVVVVAVLSMVIDGPPNVANVVAVVLSVALGFAAFQALAAASAPFTKTAETAQITTMPVVLISMGLSGLFFPLRILPDMLQNLANFTPGAAIVELMTLGLDGINRQGEAVASFSASMGQLVPPTAVLIGWFALGLAVTKSRFSWEPRR